MHIDTLLAISPLDGRYATQLEAYRNIFSEFGLIQARLQVEIEWLIHLLNSNAIFNTPQLSKETIKTLQHIWQSFGLEDAQQIKEKEKITNHDVKALEYFIAEKMKDAQLAPHISMVHFAATSEDINNMAYAIMLKNAKQQLLLDLNALYKTLRALAIAHAQAPMLSRTHGQPASPTTAGKEIAVWVQRLYGQAKTLQAQPIYGKFNGAVGNFNAHMAAWPDADWHEISRLFVTQLGLMHQSFTTQIEPHDYIAEFAHNCIRINNIIKDMCVDFWGYISIEYFKQKPKKDEVGSSTMPHKINPIDFENAEGNVGVSSCILEHLASKLTVSRYQRDLSDSTAIRNVGVGICHSALAINALHRGLQKIHLNPDALNKDLNNAWSVLTEAIQTVMRKNHVENAYEKLKELSRGKPIDQEKLHTFILTLDIPQADQKRLLALTPHDYIGNAQTAPLKTPPSIL